MTTGWKPVSLPRRYDQPIAEHRTKSFSSSGSNIECGVAPKNSHFSLRGSFQRNVAFLPKGLARFRIKDLIEFGISVRPAMGIVTGDRVLSPAPAGTNAVRQPRPLSDRP